MTGHRVRLSLLIAPHAADAADRLRGDERVEVANHQAGTLGTVLDATIALPGPDDVRRFLRELSNTPGVIARCFEPA